MRTKEGFTLTENQKVDITTGELDFTLKEHFFSKEELEKIDDDNEYVDSISNYNSDGYPMNIDDAIKILQELKEKECNFVGIDYNCDHYEYTFYGIDIHKSTKEEVDFENAKIDAQFAKQKKIDDLQAEIRKVQNS